MMFVGALTALLGMCGIIVFSILGLSDLKKKTGTAKMKLQFLLMSLSIVVIGIILYNANTLAEYFATKVW